MKKFILEFSRRGLLFTSLGPMITAIVYCFLYRFGVVSSLTVPQVVTAIFSTSFMAFIAAGITAVYSWERLPLPTAILFHAAILYLDYLCMYLLNNWIAVNLTAIGIFTAVFFLGFALIWAVIYLCIRNRINAINKKMLG